MLMKSELGCIGWMEEQVVWLCVCVWDCVCIYVWDCVYVHVWDCVYVCDCMFVTAYVYVYDCIYVYVCDGAVCMYVCGSICMCMTV